MSANDRQVAGSHYTSTLYQHWDFALDLGLDYFRGQITKYLDRYARKNGLDDIDKADHFVEKLAEAYREGRAPLHKRMLSFAEEEQLTAFVRQGGRLKRDRDALRLTVKADGPERLRELRVAIENIRGEFVLKSTP